MAQESIEFEANVVQVSAKTLASGDKETRITLSVVGPAIIEANRLADLPPEAMVRVSYKK
jgi:hypothetical protein